ncbi:MAG: agmatinase [bacterium]|nr:agmatinase [bacterium]
MHIFPFLRNYSNLEQSNYLIIGIPYEGYINSRLGSFKAPYYIRNYSELIETFSFYFSKSLEEINLFDLGDIFIKLDENNDKTVHNIYKNLKNVLIDIKKRYIFLGGDHSVTIATFLAIKDIFKDVAYIHLDAHADCHDKYLNQIYSHANVLRRISEHTNNIISIGVRTLDDFEKGFFFSNVINIDLANINYLKEALKNLNSKYIYLSLDIDFFDPSIAPAVSNPVYDGASFSDFINILRILSEYMVIAFDVVEVNPFLDYPKYNTAVLAAQAIKEFIISSSIYSR